MTSRAITQESIAISGGRPRLLDGVGMNALMRVLFGQEMFPKPELAPQTAEATARSVGSSALRNYPAQ